MIARLAGVSRTFEDGGRKREILRGIDLEVVGSEMVALVGPSGSGKTTLLSILGALDAGFTGMAEILGTSLSSISEDARAELRNLRIGFVFQAFHLLEHLSVLENVEVPLWLLQDRPARSDESKRAEEALQRVGLGGRGAEQVRTLSGGERQRVAIARAIINRPRLLLADEPTGNLDDGTGDRILEIFDAVRAEQDCAVIVATHDATVAERADRTLKLDAGTLA